MIGIGLELHGHSLASTVNIAMPTFVGLLMAAAIVWLPLLAKFMPNPDTLDAAEGAFAVSMFSVIPLCLAVILKFVYVLLAATEPDRGSSARGSH